MSLAFHKNPSFSSFLIGLPPSRYPLTSTDCVRCFPSGFFMCLSELGSFPFSSVGSCGKLWLTFTIALQCPLYLAQYRRLLHANQKTAKRQRLDGSQFRLRSQGCLFTYNSSDFGEHMWADFLAWSGTLEFLRRWSATMEQSLKSEEPGRVHLHVFMEFGRHAESACSFVV